MDRTDQATNQSEQFVYETCQRSFLSLWACVNPQGRTPRKELCDILVVFDPHVIVISVKNIALRSLGDESANRSRWERRAIDESVRQIDGAIRALGDADHVTRKDGKVGLPLPPPGRRVYHRVAIAFGGRREVSIGIRRKGEGPFVHVFDERSFSLLLRHLDTISDFVAYLEDKQRLLSRASVLMTGGEEDLLALYLQGGGKFPDGPDFFILADDLWDEIRGNAQFLSKLRLDEDSYAWDNLIEAYCEKGFEGDHWIGPGITETERALRVLAAESRFSRRSLGRSLKEFLQLSKEGKVRARAAAGLSGVLYVFFAYPSDTPLKQRREMLLVRCLAALARSPRARVVVGIGLNVPGEPVVETYSLELTMVEPGVGALRKKLIKHGEKIQQELGYFRYPKETHLFENKYPLVTRHRAERENRVATQAKVPRENRLGPGGGRFARG